ncbi:MAG: cryptochrome/photolyase family protein [Candidatus Kariarchaeaceae archaeon]|jgi:deoxyribodipyrimidine photo-lyase
MVKDFGLSLYIFRRDLRLFDNTALIRALSRSSKLICAFIFDKNLVNRNPNALEHMLSALREVDDDLREHGSQLYYFMGDSVDIIEELVKNHDLNAVFENIDYSPYSIRRSNAIQGRCEELGIPFLRYQDAVISNPHAITTNTGGRYSVFTPFYKKAKQTPPPQPQSLPDGTFADLDIANADSSLPTRLAPESNPHLWAPGGRTHAMKILSRIGDFDTYDETRNTPSIRGTTDLSSYIKFGEVSTREVYHTLDSIFGIDSPLIRQLYWRDFYIYLSIHFPHLFKGAFKQKYDKIAWSTDRDRFEKWCDGKTGFPIVDAGMRQLNRTGYMHNRIRMVVASFLVKDLHIDWRWGERYFASKLIDYDTMVNNGNWQWAASTGADAQPYFRIFNPWSQQKKFDKDCIYIKEYVEELRDLTSRSIHNLEKQRPLDLYDYPTPMIQHKTQAALAKEMFKAI